MDEYRITNQSLQMPDMSYYVEEVNQVLD